MPTLEEMKRLYDLQAAGYYNGEGARDDLPRSYLSDLMTSSAPEPQSYYGNEGIGGTGEAFQPVPPSYYGNEGRGVGVDSSQQKLAALVDERQQMAAAMGPDSRITTMGYREPNVESVPAPAPALPKNYIRNNSTGVVTSMDDAVVGGRQRALDYSSGPVEYGGQKGYRVKGDPFTIEMQDGTLVKTGQDVAATRTRQKEDLALEKSRVELDQLRQKPTSEYGKELSKRLAEADAAKLMAKTPGTVEYERAMKEQNLLKKGAAANKSATEDAVKLQGFLKSAIEQTDWDTAGFVGQILSNIGGTDATDLESVLDTIKAKIGFSELQQMRKESPTGGALGQVAVKELEFLQSVEGSLKQKQSPGQLKSHLNDILGSTKRLEADLKANPPDWTGGRQPAGATQGATAGVSRVKSMDEAMKLKSGTEFVDPNGVLRVRP